MIGRMVSEPRNMVSSRAARVQQAVGEDVAALGVGASWISSMARKATGRSIGIASTVQTK